MGANVGVKQMKGSKMKQMKTQLNGEVCNEKKLKRVKEERDGCEEQERTKKSRDPVSRLEPGCKYRMR